MASHLLSPTVVVANALFLFFLSSNSAQAGGQSVRYCVPNHSHSIDPLCLMQEQTIISLFDGSFVLGILSFRFYQPKRRQGIINIGKELEKVGVGFSKMIIGDSTTWASCMRLDSLSSERHLRECQGGDRVMPGSTTPFFSSVRRSLFCFHTSQ